MSGFGFTYYSDNIHITPKSVRGRQRKRSKLMYRKQDVAHSFQIFNGKQEVQVVKDYIFFGPGFSNSIQMETKI